MTVCLDVSVLTEKKNGKIFATHASLKIVIMANLKCVVARNKHGSHQKPASAYFRICSRLLCTLFAAFPSLVYGPSVCHSCLLKVGQTHTLNPIKNPDKNQVIIC